MGRRGERRQLWQVRGGRDYCLPRTLLMPSHSMDKYETVQGKDWEEADLREMRDRDDVLVRREGIVDWLQVEAPTSVQAQVM